MVILAVSSDFDWASNLDDQRSITRYTFNIGYGVIAWSNKKQSTIALFHREKLQSKEICVEYCKTYDNMTDMFIKPLGHVKSELFKRMLGVQDNPFSIKGELKIIRIILY